MPESVTMAEVLYVPVDEQGEPYRWGSDEEVTVSVWGDYWRARGDVQSEGRTIRALSAEELRDTLEGRWGDVTHLSYHPRPTSCRRRRRSATATSSPATDGAGVILAGSPGPDLWRYRA